MASRFVLIVVRGVWLLCVIWPGLGQQYDKQQLPPGVNPEVYAQQQQHQAQLQQQQAQLRQQQQAQLHQQQQAQLHQQQQAQLQQQQQAQLRQQQQAQLHQQQAQLHPQQQYGAAVGQPQGIPPPGTMGFNAQGQPVLHSPQQIGQEREHIQEHMQAPMDTSQMSEQELQFHYFKMHDADNNNLLDGLELAKSLFHWHDQEEKHAEQQSGGHKTEAKIFPDAELGSLIDPILEQDDKDRDGYISYAEFVQAQANAPPPPQSHQQPPPPNRV